MPAQKRRDFLRALAGIGTLTIAGCSALGDGEDLPDDCPRSQNLGVGPGDLNSKSTAEIVNEYEAQYYLHVLSSFDPESEYISVDGPRITVENLTGGYGWWPIEVSGWCGYSIPDLIVDAEPSSLPESDELLSSDRIADQEIRELLEEPRETGSGSLHVSNTEIDATLDRLERLFDSFEISGSGDVDSLYFDVEGETIELRVRLATVEADDWWTAWYRVDDHKVWRSAEEGVDPRDGELLECRTAN